MHEPLLDSQRKEGGMSKLQILILAVCAFTLAVSVYTLVQVEKNGHNHTLNEVKSMLSSLQASASAAVFGVSKFAVPYVTPREYQEQRGTCWDFTTVEFLEHSYRKQGIEQGWLQPNQYVRFSQQAYGVSLIRNCLNNPICELPGDSIAFNSTEGGEVPLLFYFPSLTTSVLPDSVCPYYNNPGNDSLCPLMDKALANNPLKFEWTANTYTTVLDIPSVKQLLLSTNRLLAWSVSMWNNNYYRPCTGADASDPQCAGGDSTKCTWCPLNKNFPTQCCVRYTGPMYNEDGEFFFWDDYVLEGGHAMALVGFNDYFTTRAGFTGGFILRNTWHDVGLRGRGSHSLRYWMQEITDMAERAICPNAYSPRSWYACPASPTDCMYPFNQTAALGNFPVQLRCVDNSVKPACNVSATNLNYFFANVTDYGDGQVILGFWIIDTAQNNKNVGFLYLPPMLQDTVVNVIQPIPSQAYNNTEECGFYFWPYEVLKQSVAKFGGFYVNDFPIKWHPQSYMANAKQFAAQNFNYSWLDASSLVQTQRQFNGPFPNLPPQPTGMRK